MEFLSSGMRIISLNDSQRPSLDRCFIYKLVILSLIEEKISVKDAFHRTFYYLI